MRLKQNPDHYRLEGDSRSDSLEERVRSICVRDIQLLREADLVTSEGTLRATEFGHSMARYYVKFETMKSILSVQSKAKVSEIVGSNLFSS